jgi:hypothetical protein
VTLTVTLHDVSDNIIAAADVGIGTASVLKAIAKTATALRKCCKALAIERRSSARASVFEQRIPFQ